MTQKYDEAKVDEFLAALSPLVIDHKNANHEHVARYVKALDALLIRVKENDYNALREATASDKSLVHIPAGNMWSENDLTDLVQVHKNAIETHQYTGLYAFRPVIDAIKAKLESKA